MKTVLITGGTGFIGKALCLELLRQGWQLVLTSRDIERSKLHFNLPVQWVQWSGKEDISDLIDFSKIDAVIHLMGESIASSRWTDQQKENILKSRVRSTEHLVQAIEQTPHQSRPKVFLSASAIGIYGDRGDQEIDESTSPGSDFLSDVCKKWESTSTRLETLGVRRCLFRIGLVLGNGGGLTETLLPLFRNGLGGKLGSGRQWMSWIHLQDLVRLFNLGLENDQWTGVFNAVSPNPVTNADFTKAFAHTTQTPALASVPKIALSLVKGEMARALLASQKVLPKRVLTMGYQFKFEDLPTALKDLFPFGSAYRREFVQWIEKPPEEVFPFFKNENNLEKLTPEFLNFHVLTKSTPEITEGTLIQYRLSLHGIGLKWQSKILSWNPPHEFVDLQVKGPYRLWHHRHGFEPMANGTLMRDVVHYDLPLGAIGRAIASLFVHRDIRKIFDYRFHRIEKLFGRS